MSALEAITSEVEKLDRHSQFLLAERLVRKLGETSEHRAVWMEESARRLDAYERGNLEACDAAEVFREMRESAQK